MIRVVSALAVVLMVAAAVGLYRFKDQASDRAQHIERLRSDIAREQRTLDVLRAEWTYLNTPRRIQELADRYLELERVATSQIATVNGLPMRPLELDPFEGTASIGGFAGGETGSVR